MTPLPYSSIETLAIGLMLLVAFFLMVQAVAFSSPRNGWLNRPWFVSLSMLAVAVAFVNRAAQYFDGAEPHVNPSAVLIALGLFVWQFVQVVYITVQSWRAREAVIRHRLVETAPQWRENDPPVYVFGDE